jgi:hypothetical protein
MMLKIVIWVAVIGLGLLWLTRRGQNRRSRPGR